VPLIIRWPGHVKAGTTSDELVSLADIMATLASVTAAELPHAAAEDSFDMLPVLLNAARSPVRPYLLMQAFAGVKTLSIRRGNWKYIDHPGSGGNDYRKPILRPFALADTAPEAPGQLYDLAADPGETTNLIDREPAIAAELKRLLDASKAAGRSRP
jgi:arylsulfatase A-like enzyme